MDFNENLRPGLRGSKIPSSRIPQSPSGRGLAEMSSSATNARSHQPPPVQPKFGTHKHKPSNLPEPQPKRETLVARAALPLKENRAASQSSRIFSESAQSTFQGGTRSGIPSGLQSRSISTASSRKISGSSFKSHGSRPPLSSRYGQSQNPPSHTRSYSSNGQQIFRPGSSTDNHSFLNGTSSVNSSKAFDPDFSDILDSKWTTKFEALKDMVTKSMSEDDNHKEVIRLYKERISELEEIRNHLSITNSRLEEALGESKHGFVELRQEMDSAKRRHGLDLRNLRRRNERDVQDARERLQRDLHQEREQTEKAAEKARKEFEEQLNEMEKAQKDLMHDRERHMKAEMEEEKNQKSRELQEMITQNSLRLQESNHDLEKKIREVDELRRERDELQAVLEREKTMRHTLETSVAEASATNLTLESSNRAMKAKIDFLESDNHAQSNAFADLHRLKQEAEEAMNNALEKLRTEETMRRKLHNQVQELKGNIRVMCRVRPASESESEDAAKIAFPDAELDSKEVIVQGPEKTSALGNVTTSNNAFSFDRVFDPASQNAEIFDEISQLVQSALDGYNVCIFCYGQTGSGKTYTMSSDDGMIPRATQQIYTEAQRLMEKGWTYKMEGSFIEVYNENLNDLLGKADDLDKKKLEIRHDLQKKTTTITDITTVELDSANRVEEIMQRASANRTVAATKANNRSSRSHSVFILRLIGENSVTGERSEGTLNLVDLAGSERLAHSQATGDRLKETQNINKSLSCLGDVIGALGQGKEGAHIPYRNSKLTYLLQNSLGGNSKTLMFVMISPLQAHLSETLTSLKFATKVHNTHIGTAKKQSKVKD